MQSQADIFKEITEALEKELDIKPKARTYANGMIAVTFEHVLRVTVIITTEFILRYEPDIALTFFIKQYDSLSAANIPGYHGIYSEKLVLEIAHNIIKEKNHKYYKTKSTFYKGISTLISTQCKW